MVLGKKLAIFNWEWGRKFPVFRQKGPFNQILAIYDNYHLLTSLLYTQFGSL